MIKAGHYTAALLLIAVGAILIVDQSTGNHYLAGALNWWPLILISFGVEFLLKNLGARGGQQQVKVALGSLFFALLVSFIVIVATESSNLNLRFLSGIHLNGGPFQLANESGKKFEKAVVNIPLGNSMKKVIIKDLNGNIAMKAGDTADIEVHTTLYVSGLSSDEAQKIADASKIAYSGSGVLTIEASGAEYKIFGIKQKPRMNLDITVPRDHQTDMQLILTSGSMIGSGLPIADELNIKTVNGSINISDVDGSVEAVTINGTVKVSAITGDVKLDTINGSVEADTITGNVSMHSTNGSVNGAQLKGNVKANTVNGKIVLTEVARGIDAKTANGGISVKSHSVGGDWKLHSTIGAVLLDLPADGNYKVAASSGFGAASSNLPLAVDKHHIEGTIGQGTFRIDADTNGSLSLNGIQ